MDPRCWTGEQKDMHYYDWKSHYDTHLQEKNSEKGFRHYQVENESGKGQVIACSINDGVQAVYNDLHLLCCGRPVSKADHIVEITYCMEGRYECDVNDRYCFYIGHGDLSIGTAGRTEAGGGFPTKRFCGLTLFLDMDTIENQYHSINEDMEIDLGVVRKLAMREHRRFVLHDNAEIREIFLSMITAVKLHRLPMLKIKILELMMILGDSEMNWRDDKPVYLSRKLVLLAKDVQQAVTEDLSCHLTLAQLSARFHASPTAIKTAFKSVYGESLRTYLKCCRLQEAQRLIRETKLPISEIAAEVGYANPGHFAVAFREKFSMTPGEYKKNVYFE